MPVVQSRVNMFVRDPATMSDRTVVIDVIDRGQGFDFSARFTDATEVIASGTNVPGTADSVLEIAKKSVLDALDIQR